MNTHPHNNNQIFNYLINNFLKDLAERCTFTVFLLLATMLLLAPVQTAIGQDTEMEPTTAPPIINNFDLDNDNAVTGLVIPTAVEGIFDHVSPVAADASIMVRITTMLMNSMFDATAPYHSTAVGVYSRIDRQPKSEWTHRNRNIAILYATYRIGMSLMEVHEDGWRQMMKNAGLDPDDDQVNEDTPIGIGNKAGFAVIEARKNDGMNQLGNENGTTYHGRPYADYTGYEPVNTAYKINDPSRWQPAIKTKGNGVFTVQKFVTPQMGMTDPYAIEDPDNYKTPPPEKSDPSTTGGMEAYKAQVDNVLEASANLTDEKKLKSELFNNKMFGLGAAPVWHARATKMSMTELIHFDFAANVAAFDAAIAAWNDKYRYDAVRPFTAIEYVYGDEEVTAWGGPGEGTVNDLPGNRWKSYIPTADHPEYPSASAFLCSATAEASRQFLGSDKLFFSWNFPEGSSTIEPGVTPSEDTKLSWSTWTEWENDCGDSRFWGGMHFMESVRQSKDPAHAIGKKAHEFVEAHIEGEVE